MYYSYCFGPLFCLPRVPNTILWGLTRRAVTLSSPRAESARAFTGRQTPTVEGGKTFWALSQNFFTETAVNSGTESRKNRSQGGKLTVMPRAKNGSSTKSWGRMAKNRIFWPKTKFWAQKKGGHFWWLTMFWPRPEKVVQRKKVPLPK